jgi:hypothetical protein
MAFYEEITHCYLGQGAVDHGIISAELLGQYLPEPSG